MNFKSFIKINFNILLVNLKHSFLFKLSIFLYLCLNIKNFFIYPQILILFFKNKINNSFKIYYLIKFGEYNK